MPPRTAKGPSSSGGHLGFAIPDAAWNTIEAAYGRELLAAVREEIGKATAHYVDFAAAEKAAPPSLPAKRRLGRLRSSAQKMLAEVDKRNSFAPEAPEFYADELLHNHLRHPASDNKNLRPWRWHRLLAPVAADLARVIAACDDAKTEMNRTSSPGYWREGSQWNDWVVWLTEIATEHQLPTGASVTVKAAEPDQYSPFIGLVRALQGCLPSDLRQSVHSDGALAEAIKRARRTA
jgi:hypothetical protein